MKPNQIEINITAFLEDWKVVLDAYKARMGFTYFDEYTLERKDGRKYARICARETKDGKIVGQEVVSAFIDLATGDILKPATWSKPAKHVRGNVFSSQFGMEAITPVGHVRYL